MQPHEVAAPRLHMPHYRFSPNDVKKTASLFSTKRGLSQEYVHLQCPKCKKFDAIKALEIGVHDGVSFPASNPDFFYSSEALSIISKSMRTFLETATSNEFRVFDIPSDPRFFAAIPNFLIHPKKGDKAFNVSRPCSECGRPSYMGFGPELYPIPENVQIGAFWLQIESLCNTPYWFVSKEIKERLEESKLTDFYFNPLFLQ